MTDGWTIERATEWDAPAVANMVGELLDEIMRHYGERAFWFDRQETEVRVVASLARERLFIWVARDPDRAPLGVITVCESYALYAEGLFATITELYVPPAARSHGVGAALIERVRAFGRERGWGRLEVTTPPLPAFDRSLAFYERQGFAVTGGRKLKFVL
ncbi:MAG: GNAT family N-acetyltransferase [Magnetococcales bacterium]|nr:GNAT family N-acetyltransferase [Magnetococcales bacterium]